jgi:hypothetical protein
MAYALLRRPFEPVRLLALCAADAGLRSGGEAAAARGAAAQSQAGNPVGSLGRSASRSLRRTSSRRCTALSGGAQMQSHGDLDPAPVVRPVARTRRGVLGRGVSDVDRWVRTMGVPARCGRWEEAADSGRAWAASEAFVPTASTPTRRNMHDRLTAAMCGRRVLPVTVSDLLAARSAASFTSRSVANPQSLRTADAAMGRRGLEHVGGLCRSDRGVRPRAPAREPAPATGEIFFTCTEVQFSTPVLSAYGAALVGMPFPGIAFNDRAGLEPHEQHRSMRRPLRTAAR